MKDIAELSQIKRKTSPCPADIPRPIKAHVYIQVIKFRQVLTKRPLTPNSGGTRVLKVPQNWGI